MKVIFIRTLFILVLVPLLITSCSQATEPDSLSTKQNIPITDQPVDPSHKNGKPDSSAKETNGLEISSSQQQTETDPTAAEADKPIEESDAVEEQPQPDESTVVPQSLEQFTLAQPRLMGMTVGDSQEFVTQMHGLPQEMTTMSDGEQKLTVYHYDGFMIGMNVQQVVEFITVMSSHVESGLNGFHIGGTVEDAIHSLGEPSTENDYVLAYQNEVALLKLDVDPATNEVITARLFPAEQ